MLEEFLTGSVTPSAPSALPQAFSGVACYVTARDPALCEHQMALTCADRGVFTEPLLVCEAQHNLQRFLWLLVGPPEELQESFSKRGINVISGFRLRTPSACKRIVVCTMHWFQH